MKRIAAIFFLVLLLQKIGCYFVFLSIQQAYIREDVEKNIIKQLPNDELVKFVFTESEFQHIEWERENKEFRFQGKLYDIVRNESFNGKHVFYCFDDKKEAKIKQQITDYQQQHTKNNFIAFYNLLLQSYIPPQNFTFQLLNNHFIQSRNCFEFTSFYLSTFLEKQSPPPWGV